MVGKATKDEKILDSENEMRVSVRKKDNKRNFNLAKAKQSSSNVSNEKETLSSVLRDSKQFCLLPGKAWKRSVSIVNNYQNSLIGRGCNWSETVKTVLNLQSEGTY